MVRATLWRRDNRMMDEKWMYGECSAATAGGGTSESDG